MKNQMVGVVALIGVLALGGWNYFHRPAKIGYVETSVVLEQFTEAINARNQFEKAQKDWDKNLKTLNDSLMAGMNQMKVDFNKASKEGKQAISASFEKKQADYQRYTEVVKKMSQEKEQELMLPVIKKVNSFLDIWGKQHGYDLVLGTTTAGNILQANPNLNLTARILKDLNEQYKNLPGVESLNNPEMPNDTSKSGAK